MSNRAGHLTLGIGTRLKMNYRKFKILLAAFTVSAFLLQVFSFTVTAQFAKQGKSHKLEQPDQVMPAVSRSKIAPDLEQKADDLLYGRQADQMQRVIIQLKSETPLNEMFGNSMSEAEQKEMFAQEASSNREKTGILISDLSRVNGSLKKSYNNLGLVSAELPLSQIRELMQSDNVAYISPDREVAGLGHVGKTVGLYNPGIFDRGDTNASTWLSGTGVGVAVIDSGAYRTHDLFKISGTESFKVTAYDFTGQNNVADQYGHGSHVASVLSGDATLGSGAYEGAANGVSIYSLKVLNSLGAGTSSNVIAAINWAITNKSAKNIRVINMSLGTPAKDSYVNDPLCQAARRAVNAGIVVVASAGNYGKDLLGNEMYGGINSPGMEPSVITVGAVNTYGTDYRSDDTIATYSSRGPTRGYVTLSNGARKYDNLIKPDIVAPGNKLIATASPNSTLVTSFPQLKTGRLTDPDEQVMYLSGTSMAAPVVAGAAALLIDTNPTLTPNLVKAILMYTAQPLRNYNTLEQGAGMVNFDGAVRVARLVKSNAGSLVNGNALLSASLPASQSSVISGETVYWGKGVVTNYGILYGDELMTKWQAMYASGVLISDGTTYSSNILSKVSAKTTAGVNLYQGAITNNGVLISDGTNWLTATAMAGSPTPYINSQGVLVSDGVLISDGVLVGDGVLCGDSAALATLALFGENTACMLPAP